MLVILGVNRDPSRLVPERRVHHFVNQLARQLAAEVLFRETVLRALFHVVRIEVDAPPIVDAQRGHVFACDKSRRPQALREVGELSRRREARTSDQIIHGSVAHILSPFSSASFASSATAMSGSRGT